MRTIALLGGGDNLGGNTYSSGTWRSVCDEILGETAGALLTSELFDRAEEDLGRELVIVNRASSGRLVRIKVCDRVPALLPRGAKGRCLCSSCSRRLSQAETRQSYRPPKGRIDVQGGGGSVEEIEVW
jgi:hypothetical protein